MSGMMKREREDRKNEGRSEGPKKIGVSERSRLFFLFSPSLSLCVESACLSYLVAHGFPGPATDSCDQLRLLLRYDAAASAVLVRVEFPRPEVNARRVCVLAGGCNW